MKQILRFLNQFLLPFVLIVSIKNVDADVNYKLTSVYYGNQGWFMDQIGNLTLWTGKHNVAIVLFTDWCNNSMYGLFNTQLNNIWNSKSIPLITWGLTECNGDRPGIIKLVNNNTFDGYINEFSDRLKKWLAGNDEMYGTNDDRRAYLRLGMKSKGTE